MEDKNKREIFNSTEINTDQIEKPDEADEWDVMSVFDVDTYPTPYISVPRMHEVEGESIGGACGASIKCDIHDTREISSKHDQEQDNEKIRMEMAEAILEPFAADEQLKEITNRIAYIEYKQMLESDILQRDMWEAMREFFPQDLQKQVNKKIVTEREDMRKSESVSKVKEDNECQVFQRGDSRSLEEFCKFEASTKAAKVDKLEKENDSQVKMCSKYSVSFRNEECDSPSSDKKENDEKNNSSKNDEEKNDSFKNEEEKN